MFTVKWSYQY